MASSETTTLNVARREPSGSRSARRLRRTGHVPGVIYGGDQEPESIEVDGRTLRHALANAGAVIELSIDGGSASPVVVKDLARHPVNGETMHIDLLRVRMDQAIQSTVVVDLVGAEDAPGVRLGNGVLEQVTREVTIEALPGDIPDTLQHDVSELEIGETLTAGRLNPPRGVTVVDDPETVIATITPPRLQVEESQIETETEVVGEAAPEGEAEPGTDAAAESAGDAASE